MTTERTDEMTETIRVLRPGTEEPARSMADVIRAHGHGGTDPASWSPGNPIRWACFGPECDAVDEGTDMHLSLTDWYAGHLAGELEKAGFGDIRPGAAADPGFGEDTGGGHEDFGLDEAGQEDPVECDGSESCGASIHIHGCFTDRPDVLCDEHNGYCGEPGMEFQ